MTLAPSMLRTLSLTLATAVLGAGLGGTAQAHSHASTGSKFVNTNGPWSASASGDATPQVSDDATTADVYVALSSGSSFAPAGRSNSTAKWHDFFAPGSEISSAR